MLRSLSFPRPGILYPACTVPPLYKVDKTGAQQLARPILLCLSLCLAGRKVSLVNSLRSGNTVTKLTGAFKYSSLYSTSFSKQTEEIKITLKLHFFADIKLEY